jgi:hypothetical protein
MFVATDVHYLASGGARAAAVVSADAGFSRLVADRVELVPHVEPYRPGEFYEPGVGGQVPLPGVLSGCEYASCLAADAASAAFTGVGAPATRSRSRFRRSR